MNISSQNITDLKDNEVFVFGSNLAGRHGKGAAKAAMNWGAKYGQAEGLQGRTYGIPTVNASISAKLDISDIGRYVSNFIAFAKTTPDKKYLVTEIGCGLAGHKVQDIAPLFVDAINVDNIYLPESFIKFITKQA